MQVLYDTRTVRPLDRYDYYRARSGTELAPVSVQGRAPGRLLAAMSVAKIGDFKLEEVTWSADSPVATLRTDQLIRECDPECYRIFLTVSGLVRVEQAGNQLELRDRNMALLDLSRPFVATHGTERGKLRAVMLSFPRALVPLAPSTVRPLVGTVIPTSLSGRSLIAQFLIGLTETAEATDDPGLVEVLQECAVGLIRERLGRPGGITAHTCRLVDLAHIRNVIRQRLCDPALGPGDIAGTANISVSKLHAIFQEAGLTPMQLVKRLRLEACHRILQDPTLPTKTLIKDVSAAHGYRRHDQFAHDFKQFFGVTASQVRRQAGR